MSKRPNEQTRTSVLDLPLRFALAFLAFTFAGWIGWLGIILVLLRVFGVVHWSWWLTALPLEYGVVYCIYMTIDGFRYRRGSKNIGAYARHTTGGMADIVEAWNASPTDEAVPSEED